MKIHPIIKEYVATGMALLYHQKIDAESVLLSSTKSEFDGDITVTIFPLAKLVQKNPEETGNALGQYLLEHSTFIAAFNVIKGFLNLTIRDSYWLDFFASFDINKIGILPKNNKVVMVEYSSPNTNKPLHLGHVRNILLGWSTAKIYEAAGYNVIKTQIINDRGIAICKSMLAWQLYGNGATPESTGIKGDHFVGDYYVLFETKYREEYKHWQQSQTGQSILEEKKKAEQSKEEFFALYKNTYFNEYSALGKQARELLLKWENNDPDAIALWENMNNWVYVGFNETYQNLGVSFDKNYYESNTYLLGKDMIEAGLKKKVFYKKEDNSVWIDLTDKKLDHKVVLRGDGTSIYITQDIGMAPMRYNEFHFDKCIFVVADEQNYHFQVLFEILKKLGEPYADEFYHLSYGMVELPTGKMKSREGNVVDADDLVQEVIRQATNEATMRAGLTDISESEQQAIFRKIGLGALKYHILKVNPKKKMIFIPEESVDMEGHTGPYIQNAYVRIQSILRKVENENSISYQYDYKTLEATEKDLIQTMYQYNDVIVQAADEFDPSYIADIAYRLAKQFHKFYHDLQILRAATENTRNFRLHLCTAVAAMLQHSMYLLGIEMPDKM
ncbi:MAG: arginine--tRNA ligase [Saprospiraceae bacterium]|nr:arginine--tRNA ligase [Saprospiraceae bacterium]